MNEEKIGLIAAMPSESAALLRLFRGRKRIRIGSLPGAGFQRGGRECILVTSGMGTRRAAEAARILIETAHPSCLISFGIAGAVREDLNIGDVVLAMKNYTFEGGSLSAPRPLAPLSGGARAAVAQVLRPFDARLFAGSAVTTREAQLGPQSSPQLENPVLEMETAGILQAAAPGGIPLVVLRSVSDGPQSPIPFDLETVMDDDYKLRPAAMLKAILKHPEILLQSGRMARNSRVAADNAARAVLAVLDQPASFLQS